jgi:hypothetical protein
MGVLSSILGPFYATNKLQWKKKIQANKDVGWQKTPN